MENFNNSVPVTCVKKRSNAEYGIQFCELDENDVDNQIHYFKMKIIFLTEKEFIDLTKQDLKDIQAYSRDILNV